MRDASQKNKIKIFMEVIFYCENLGILHRVLFFIFKFVINEEFLKKISTSPEKRESFAYLTSLA